jgi:surface protein
MVQIDLGKVVGNSAYESYKATTSDNPVKTEAEWLESLKGANGSLVRINSTTKMWELSSDNGTTYTSLGIKAEGTDGTTPQIRINSTTFDWELSIDGGLKWIDMNVAAKQAVSGAEVVQVTGQETGKVMSQKAVTDAIANASVNVSDIYKCFDGFTNLIYKKTDGTIVKKSNIPSGAIWKSALAGDTEIEEIYSMPSLTGVTSIWGLFQNDTNLTYVNAEKWDTTSVTNMYGCFNGTAITELDLSGWDTSAVTDMSYMFNNCVALTTLDLGNFDTSAVTDMSYMFNNCVALTTLDLGNFDTSAVTDMSYMF